MKQNLGVLALFGAAVLGCTNQEGRPTAASPRATPAPAPHRSSTGPCSLIDPAFCDTFTKPAPGGRGGDLDERSWSTARVGQRVNSSQGELVSWPAASLSACGKVMEDVFPGQDIISCRHPVTGRSELTSVFHDGNGPAFQSFRVIQPFDFADRVGHIALDIDAKTQTPEGHGWWWELVIADEPVPVPYQEFVSHALMGHKALVIEFEGISSFDGSSNELSRVYVEDNYKYAHEFTREQAGYVSFKTREEVLNHVEILVGRDVLEVWATDLDDMSTFRKVAHIDGLGLTFTRGFVNLQHSQYNAGKGGLGDSVTYHVGSLGFDGPKLPRPRSYQVPEALTTGRTSDVRNLGYQIDQGISTCCGQERNVPSFKLEHVELADAVAARINLDAWYFTKERSIEFRLNAGAWRTFKHPYPDSTPATRAVSMPVELADLREGQNTLEMRTAGASTQPPMVVANLELEVVPR